MNHAKFLRLLTAIFAIATAILGFASYAELLPKEYAAIVGCITGILLGLKEITVIVGDLADDGVRNNSFKPDGTKILALLLCLSVLSLASCSSFTKADAIDYGKRVAVSAGEVAVALAEIRLDEARQSLTLARARDADSIDIHLKFLALIAAQEALHKAEAALVKERAKLDAKQPRNVQPQGDAGTPARNLPAPDSGQECPHHCEEPRGEDSAPRCLQITSIVPLRPLNLSSDGRRLSASASVNHPSEVRRDAHDAQGEPALPPTISPVMKQSGASILFPKLGAQVAAHLTTY